MKNQYVGDIHDYRKYGLLRSIIHSTEFRVFVVWMLTHNDERSDGKYISYLEHPSKWSNHDPDLFNLLKQAIATEKNRSVSLIENSALLQNTEFFSRHVPDENLARNSWFSEALNIAQEFDLVFLDPDNGLEVKSTPFGKNGSSKFLFWREVDELWIKGCSLLIYQHFIRENRADFIQRKISELKNATKCSSVVYFSTSHVVFLLALQPEHQKFLNLITATVQARWKEQFSIGC